jgi:phage terminase large subunit
LTQTASERFARLTGERKRELITGAADIRHALLEQLSEQSGIKWPSPKYRENPVGFFREILGVEPWYAQCEILEAMVTHPRGAVKSGQKTGKSNIIAGASLWVYSSFEDAAVLMTSTTSRQVDSILWLELRKMLARSGKCVACKLEDPDDRTIGRPCPHSAIIPEKPANLARTGIHSEDFRSISGFTAREAEAVQGKSGKNLWYFPDEASGIPPQIFDAMEGNRAGGAKLWMFGNPTKNEGEFYDAFHSKAKFYWTYTISSETTPNVIEGREVIPGLAGRSHIEEKKEEWGENSPLYKVRIKGEFAEKEDGKIFSIHDIGEAELRWHEMNRIGDETAHAARARIQGFGRLFLGIDLAGATGMGDEEMFVSRRGPFMYGLTHKPGLTNESRLVEILAVLERDRLPREVPVVVIDRLGDIGSKFHNHARAFLEMHPGAFVLVSVRASDAPARRPLIFGTMRDELTGNFEEWLRAGGGIPEDAKLTKEMHAMEWDHGQLGKLKVTPKKLLKKKLGRSPDRYDACVLAAWESLSLRDGIEDAPASVREKAAQVAHAVAHGAHMHVPAGFDPYAGGDAFRRR